MAIEEQYKTSGLSVTGLLKIEPQSDLTAKSPYWGYRDMSNTPDPFYSQLHSEGYIPTLRGGLGYSVDGTPNVRLVNFNLNGSSTVKSPSLIDELDTKAPRNTNIGPPVPNGGSVVSQIYKSIKGVEDYPTKGPKGGRY